MILSGEVVTLEGFSGDRRQAHARGRSATVEYLGDREVADMLGKRWVAHA